MRIGILVVAYEASATLESVLSRIPDAFRSSIDTILVCDDASSDDTYQVGLQLTVGQFATNTWLACHHSCHASSATSSGTTTHSCPTASPSAALSFSPTQPAR
jgi:hypothetical protein